MTWGIDLRSLTERTWILRKGLTLLVAGFLLISTQRGEQGTSQSASDEIDYFAKYPVEQVFRGLPAPPILKDPAARRYRTRIRLAVAEGIVFAGHYAVAVWGCGAGCSSFAIIDAVSGKVYVFPATVSQVNEEGDRLTYTRNSRAIHVIGSLNEEHSADRWYVWNGRRFELISEKPPILADEGP